MSDWKSFSIGELIVNIGDGGTPSRATIENFGGDIPWVVIDDIQHEIRETKETLSQQGFHRSSAKLWQEGSIILSTGATIGEVGIARIPLTTKQGISGIVCGSQLLPEFFYYKLQSLRTHLNSIAQGSTIREIRPPLIKKIKIDIPTSIEEQNAIANILSTIDEAIAQSESLVQKYQFIKQGLMSDLLSPKKNWKNFRLGQLFQIQTGATPLRAKDERYFANGQFPWVKTMDLNEAWIIDTDERITAVALKESSCKLLPPSTVLVAMYGGWEQVGRTGILEIDAATNQAIASLVNLYPNLIDPYFIMKLLQENRYKWKRVAASTRKDPNITRLDVENFEIVIPEDINEQRHISLILSEQYQVITTEKDNLAKLQLLKQGLMQDLLSGQVRVKV